ncbi:hypothetical protein ELUCI_v1c03030 [Williamsoniiplasma lucivorax]|uniref:Uncharacterized protein n=1 Tax=Williamsoniiplasma lucivorax TaxID=209274 RepID=A0A2S5RFL7_9MOLU|nr:hypothetical protein ELUCI_v1c03030 [Williamsoniiplasma lucivorax]
MKLMAKTMVKLALYFALCVAEKITFTFNNEIKNSQK